MVIFTQTNRIKKVAKEKKSTKPKTQLAEAKAFAERVEKKAYELYEQRGCKQGHDREDWFEAERIVEEEMNGKR